MLKLEYNVITGINYYLEPVYITRREKRSYEKLEVKKVKKKSNNSKFIK